MPNDAALLALKTWLWERKRDGKNQRWLAKRLKVSESHVSNILSGHIVPSDELAVRLSRITGIDLRESKVA